MSSDKAGTAASASAEISASTSEQVHGAVAASSSAAPSLPGSGGTKDTLAVSRVQTVAYTDQKPGTSGLRKKTKVFMQKSYLHNFIQATFDAVAASGTDITSGALLVGGDGRYFNPEATQVIVQMAAANGIRRIVIGQDGLLNTPAVSAIIRERGPSWKKCFGAFILTASHNPGGPDEDFGIKYNCANGGPAPTGLTNDIFERTKVIKQFLQCENFPGVDTSVLGETVVSSADNQSQVSVEVVSATGDYVALLQTVFDFAAIRRLVARKDFGMLYDCMGGVQGPYAKKVFVDLLGLPSSSLMHATPLPDFGGGHADPNLTYAHALTKRMGVDRAGNPVASVKDAPCLGAAGDGDGDRNMILGRRFFVTPSDSLAIIAAHANLIPFFKQQGGLKSVARSMPTSGAADLVAARLKLRLFETPTGWKFFGNIMDSKLGGENLGPVICGEESFGTGSDHVREKDGLWAVLCWLQILAHYNCNAASPFVHVEDIVKAHWKSYGRNYYCRYDYEGVAKPAAHAVMNGMETQFEKLPGSQFGSYKVASADQFAYKDLDGSVTPNQGVRILMEDGSRIVLRLSGTAGSGATIRLYLEAYESRPTKLFQTVAEALKELVAVALQISQIPTLTGMDAPTVIT